MKPIVSVIFAVITSTLTACQSEPSDSSQGEGSATSDFMCAIDKDCDDGLFCNGMERCAPASKDANSSGCILASAPPCKSEGLCEEEAGLCRVECDEDPDPDGDGSVSILCGGDDCDDSNSNRYPGNTEVCDDEDVDEDCDPTTFGFRDQDSDGWPDAQCCNDEACGTDCDDLVAVIHPSENELCDGLDNDCNGEIDEGVAYGDLPIWYRDADGDGFGLLTAQRAVCASQLEGYVRIGGDCDDLESRVHPEAVEQCDGIDNDCDPGSHACWLLTRTSPPVEQPEFGVIGPEKFRFDCSIGGNTISSFYGSKNIEGLEQLSVSCGSLKANPDKSVCAWGWAEPTGPSTAIGGTVGTVSVGTEFLPMFSFGEPFYYNAPSRSPSIYCDDFAVQHRPPVMQIHFQSNQFDHLDYVGISQVPTHLFGDALVPEYLDSFVVGNKGDVSVGCSEGMSLAGIYGSFSSAGYLSSIGAICESIAGVEHL